MQVIEGILHLGWNLLFHDLKLAKDITVLDGRVEGEHHEPWLGKTNW